MAASWIVDDRRAAALRCEALARGVGLDELLAEIVDTHLAGSPAGSPAAVHVASRTAAPR